MSEAAEELDFKEGEPINLKVDREPEMVEVEDKPEAKAEDGQEAEPKPDEKAEEKPKIEFTPEQQEVFNEAIGKKVAGQREAERKAEEAAKRAAELEAELQKLKEPEKPEIPPIPDPYDDDFEAKVAERDEAIKAAAQWDRDQYAREQMALQAEQQRQREIQERQNASAQSFYERGDKLGHGAAELDAAANTLVNNGLAGAKGAHIINHDQGPELAVFLAKNPMMTDEIAQMDDMQAAIYLETQVLPKALAARESKKPEPSTPEMESPGAGVGIPDENWGADGWTIT